MRQRRLVQRQHPLYSPIALLATLIMLLLLGVALWFSGGRAFSPGELSAVARSGRQSGGVSNHAAVAGDCSQCHEPFAGIAAAGCENCHVAIGQQRQTQTGLHGRLSTSDCTLCHREHLGADHDLFAAAFDQFSQEHHDALFALTGAHATLDCADCHQDEQYAGTPGDCVGCHAEPALHQGLFGTDCARCHTAEGWRPAALTAHTFPLDHGDEGTIACATCHTLTFNAYTCDACHEAAEMAEEHEEEGISAAELVQCAECHPTGLEDEE